MKQMISYQDAKQIVQDLGAAYQTTDIDLPLEEAVGYVCAEDILAPIDVQPFDNSAMDGFAVRFEDLQGANEDAPVHLDVDRTIAAGDPMGGTVLAKGQCIEIMTGAAVPAEADAVVPVELTSQEETAGKIIFTSEMKKGANIRYAGEDFKKGKAVLTKGTRLLPQHIMALATLGVDTVTVRKPLQAMFLATGDELIDDLSQDLQPGQIYNSNRPYGLSVLKQMGVQCCNDVPKLPDDVDGFVSLLNDVMEKEIDLVISSGAVSAGKFDFVKEGLQKIGAEILFHKVKIKPGKPNLCAKLPNRTLYFGLPGNPVATAAGLRFFVQPCLQAILGLEKEEPIYAVAKNDFKKRAGLQMFLKAVLDYGSDGRLTVDLMDGQESFKVSPFIDMNTWAIAPEAADKISAGDIVELYPFYAGQAVL